jgi:hypothetical protein
MISPLLSANKNFSPKKGLPMNPDGVRHAERQKRTKTPVEEVTAAAAAVTSNPSAKCIRRYAILAELTLRFLFNPVAINRFIAVIAISRKDNSIKTTKKIPCNSKQGIFFSIPDNYILAFK